MHRRTSAPLMVVRPDSSEVEFDMELADGGSAKKALSIMRKAGSSLAVEGDRAVQLISQVKIVRSQPGVVALC
jgi:hypothetical protein